MIRYLRFLSGRERTREANRHLGLTLAFVAGAVNAGGFLAIAQYTSHMTGVLSSVADNLALGRGRPVLAGLCAFTSFVAGACFSAILIQWARFLAANFTGFLLNRGTYAVLVTFVAVAAREPVIATSAGAVAGMFVNFHLSRRLVFR